MPPVEASVFLRALRVSTWCSRRRRHSSHRALLTRLPNMTATILAADRITSASGKWTHSVSPKPQFAKNSARQQSASPCGWDESLRELLSRLCCARSPAEEALSLPAAPTFPNSKTSLGDNSGDAVCSSILLATTLPASEPEPPKKIVPQTGTILSQANTVDLS